MATTKTAKTAKTVAKSDKTVKSTKQKMHELDLEFVKMFENVDTPEKWHKCFYNLPTQFVSGDVYRGRNFVKLSIYAMLNEWSTPFFAPFSVTKENKDLKIKKGSHAVRCEFFKYTERFITESVYNGLKADQKKYIKEKKSYKDNDHRYFYVYPMVSQFLTFNADSFEDTDVKKALIKKCVKTDKTATNGLVVHILEKSGAKIVRCATQSACYQPYFNKIALPNDDMVTDRAKFNGTCLHELAHWTAANVEDLKRDIDGIFGSQSYAFEELIAEFASAFICARLGIESKPLVSVDYLRGWHTALKNNPEYLGKAIAQAQKIADWTCKLAESYKPEAETEVSKTENEINEIIELDADDLGFELEPLKA